MARNLGISQKQRKSTHTRIEKFLLDTMAFHGLDPVDTLNIALEKHLVERGYLNDTMIEKLQSISEIEKMFLNFNIELSKK